MNSEQKIFIARVSNYLDIIKEKTENLVKEHINDIDMTIKFLNGDFYQMAHEEFVKEYQQGLYDKQLIKL
ncbi:MAG: hypothetical protein ACI4S3_07315 [Candidatus Gastranaerophilaceae bacterium]